MSVSRRKLCLQLCICFKEAALVYLNYLIENIANLDVGDKNQQTLKNSYDVDTSPIRNTGRINKRASNARCMILVWSYPNACLKSIKSLVDLRKTNKWWMNSRHRLWPNAATIPEKHLLGSNEETLNGFHSQVFIFLLEKVYLIENKRC